MLPPSPRTRPFCPPEDMIHGVPFMIEEEGSIHFECLCQAPLSLSGPTIAHPSTLGFPGMPPQAVVLPPLLSEKVGTRLFWFCDVWRRKGRNGWVCKALGTHFQLRFNECAPRTCTHSPFVDRGPVLKRKALSALVHKIWRNEAIKIIRNVSSPGFYSSLFLVPKTSGGRRPVIDLSLLDTFLDIPHFTYLIEAYFHNPSGLPKLPSVPDSGMDINLCQYLDGWLVYSIKASGTQAKFSLSVTRWHF